MHGRYGHDELSRFLLIVSFVFILSGSIRYLSFLLVPALGACGWALYRTFSRNRYARQNKLYRCIQIKNPVRQKFNLIKAMWRGRKTHRYCKCPYCKAVVRITKPGNGRTISIHCPHCGRNFEKKTDFLFSLFFTAILCFTHPRRFCI